MEVVGTAAHGRIALTKIEQLDPDIVTLDVDMPVMGGLETLTELRASGSNVPVIMFSTLTDRGSETTIEALARGASDYAAKPSDVGSSAEATEVLQRDLLAKLKALVPGSGATAAVREQASMPKRASRPIANDRIDAVLIGSSTGGPNALATVFGALTHSLDVPMFIVQHIPTVFSKLLAERLDRSSAMRVVEAAHGERAEAGTAYMAPGGRHMTVQRKGGEIVLELNDGPLVNSCRPSVDVLFDSAAEVYDRHQLGIILTGMGDDGLAGCRRLSTLGAPILSQDQATSTVWGMPAAVAHAGLSDEILPIDRIADRLTAWVDAASRPAVARAS